MDRFRKDDPDAAEKASAIYAQARGWNGGVSDNISRALRAVLDAIEPRLPTRSEVVGDAEAMRAHLDNLNESGNHPHAAEPPKPKASDS